MNYNKPSKVGRDTLIMPGICPKMGQKNGPLSHFTRYNWPKKAHSVPRPYLAHNGQLCVILPYLTAILAYFRHISRGRLSGRGGGELSAVLALGGGVCPLALLGGEK